PTMEYSLTQIQIDHGRQHQIRLHMASIGHPLVTDSKYSAQFIKEDSRVCNRLFLHASYLKCVLPENSAGEEIPFRLACRLPSQLQRCLLATLTRNRTADESLSAEAIALCEALLMPDPQCSDTSTVPVASRDSAFEAKMSARRRDEFLSSYNFSSGEREEVMGSLSRLSSAEERSSTLLAFQADGETQTSAVVERFA
ncbi:unnamed protein product, partial [Polarella glacialis]